MGNISLNKNLPAPSFAEFKKSFEDQFKKMEPTKREKAMADKYTELTGIEVKWEKSDNTSKSLKSSPSSDKIETSSK